MVHLSQVLPATYKQMTSVANRKVLESSNKNRAQLQLNIYDFCMTSFSVILNSTFVVSFY